MWRAAALLVGAVFAGVGLTGCAVPAAGSGAGGQAHTEAPAPAPRESVPVLLHRLGPADLLLLGEQHDAPEHQQLQLAVVKELTHWNELAALVLEMADAGHHTRQLPPTASEGQVRHALGWRDSAWPWAAYGPAVMAAVRAGVPVLGGNLPRQDNVATMRQPAWDLRVPPDVLAQQHQAVDEGHCQLLPKAQIAPMARVQIARDVQLANTLATAAVRGQTVLLLTGSQHAHRGMGVPLHLPSQLRTKTVRLDASGPRADDGQAFDAVWPTSPVPPRDFCRELAGQWPARDGANGTAPPPQSPP